MPNSKIRCLIVMPYLHEKMMMEVSFNQKIENVMDVLCKKYQSHITPKYFYHFEKKYVLDASLSFKQAGVKNGDILYWI